MEKFEFRVTGQVASCGYLDTKISVLLPAYKKVVKLPEEIVAGVCQQLAERSRHDSAGQRRPFLPALVRVKARCPLARGVLAGDGGTVPVPLALVA